jgi:hypothetical protein
MGLQVALIVGRQTDVLTTDWVFCMLKEENVD